jgi:hypothetical protein
MTAQMSAALASVTRRDPTYVFVSGRTGTRYTHILTGFKAALTDARIDPAGVVIRHFGTRHSPG